MGSYCVCREFVVRCVLHREAFSGSQERLQASQVDARLDARRCKIGCSGRQPLLSDGAMPIVSSIEKASVQREVVLGRAVFGSSCLVVSNESNSSNEPNESLPTGTLSLC